jgi:lipopolysaccharide/colanic/teichoic acid biosynthesis glycosyltransferase
VVVQYCTLSCDKGAQFDGVATLQKIAVTGASGFIGSQLVPKLAELGHQLLLVGRNPDTLHHMFPGLAVCTYDTLQERAAGFDAIVHLAVLNNNSNATPADYEAANVGMLQSIVAAAKQAGIKTLVNFSTFHALDGKSTDYAISKRAAVAMLDREADIVAKTVYMPAVYGERFAGNLSVVKKLPKFLRPLALKFLSSLAPTVHVQKIVELFRGDIRQLPPVTLLHNSQDKNPVFLLTKKIIDLSFCLFVAVFLGWLLLVVWVLVRATSPGPGIFSQVRVGKHAKPFTCYKFRTMKAGTKQAGTHEVTADSVTGIGRFLRKTKIDELPQIWNIAKGELSLVGPRPCLPVQGELIAERQKRGVFDVLPGITGLAQVQGIDMSDPVRLAELDSRYIAQRCLLLELKIMIATVRGGGQGDKVKAN